MDEEKFHHPLTRKGVTPMKKLSLILSALVLLLLLTACDNHIVTTVSTAPTTAPETTVSPTTTAPETTVAPTAIPVTTVPEVSNSQEAQNIIAIRALFEAESSWYRRALLLERFSSDYLDITTIFRCGFPGESKEFTDEEWAYLKDIPGFDRSKELIRLPVDRMNQVLRTCFGIVLSDIDPVSLTELVYLESTGCYYLMADNAYTEPVTDVRHIKSTDSEHVFAVHYRYQEELRTAYLYCNGQETTFLSGETAKHIRQDAQERTALENTEYSWTVYRNNGQPFTPGDYLGSSIASVEALEQYLVRHNQHPLYALDASADDPGQTLSQLTAHCDAAFFRENILVLISCVGEKNTLPTVSRVDYAPESAIPFMVYIDDIPAFPEEREHYTIMLTIPAKYWNREWDKNSYGRLQLRTVYKHLGVYWHYDSIPFLPVGDISLPLSGETTSITNYTVKTCYTALIDERGMGRQGPVDGGITSTYADLQQLLSHDASEMYDETSTTVQFPVSYRDLLESYDEAFFEDHILVDVFIEVSNTSIPTVERLEIVNGMLRVHYNRDETNTVNGPFAYFYHLLIEVPKVVLDSIVGLDFQCAAHTALYIPTAEPLNIYCDLPDYIPATDPVSLPAEPVLDDLVTTGYTGSACWQDLCGNVEAPSFCLPSVTPFSADAIAINREIAKIFNPTLAQGRNSFDGKATLMEVGITYSAALHNNILTILITTDTHLDYNIYRTFALDITTGQRLDQPELVSRVLDISYAEFLYRATYTTYNYICAKGTAFPSLTDGSYVRSYQLYLSANGTPMICNGRPAEITGSVELPYDPTAQGSDPTADGSEYYHWLFTLQPGDTYALEYWDTQWAQLLKTFFDHDSVKLLRYLAAEDAACSDRVVAYLLEGVSAVQRNAFLAQCTSLTAHQDPAISQLAQRLLELPEPADDEFVRVADYIPDIITDLRYATEDNFTGEVIYDFSDAYLRYGTVKKLAKVQEALRAQGLTLKIWDAFRPIPAQYKLWEVYPDPNYVANPTHGFSAHSQGNTLDITLCHADGTELKMPTGFDVFSALADRDYSDCTPEAAANAQLLEALMVQTGFIGYFGEWWHYTDTDGYAVDSQFIPS